MSSKNVAIQRTIYDALEREKRRGESFTELFARLLHQPGTLEELRGAWGVGGAAEDQRRLARLRRTGGGGES
ncbi:MAG TPA: antitoxin VapB family protein [Thermoplasmata archaeon]|nr:antitoxin VapB family protein [Thermoplasmata archaeon]